MKNFIVNLWEQISGKVVLAVVALIAYFAIKNELLGEHNDELTEENDQLKAESETQTLRGELSNEKTKTDESITNQTNDDAALAVAESNLTKLEQGRPQ